MANATHLEILRSGVRKWNAGRRAHARAPRRILPDLSNASLEGLNLRRYDLSRANLWNAQLQKADLRGANLSYAHMRGVDLSGANLAKAEIRFAVLSHTRLVGTSLAGADLCGTRLRRAVLHGANLSRANLRHASLAEVDLTDAILRGQRSMESGPGGEGEAEGRARLDYPGRRSVPADHRGRTGSRAIPVPPAGQSQDCRGHLRRDL